MSFGWSCHLRSWSFRSQCIFSAFLLSQKQNRNLCHKLCRGLRASQLQLLKTSWSLPCAEAETEGRPPFNPFRSTSLMPKSGVSERSTKVLSRDGDTSQIRPSELYTSTSPPFRALHLQMLTSTVSSRGVRGRTNRTTCGCRCIQNVVWTGFCSPISRDSGGPRIGRLNRWGGRNALVRSAGVFGVNRLSSL